MICFDRDTGDLHGRLPKNIEALANPEALALFESLPELQS
jgi:hypothetical protein